MTLMFKVEIIAFCKLILRSYIFTEYSFNRPLCDSVFRTEFHLDESGDVSWKVSEEAESMPFFSCETYEVNVKVTVRDPR